MTPAPRLHAALHWRVEPPFAPDAASSQDRAARAGHLAGAQSAEACARIGFEAEAVVVASTILDCRLTASAGAQARFEAALRARSGRPLHGIVNAYLCAGWGFVLRHAMRHTKLRRLALCIVDVDLHDMQWQREHPVIGRSGFGLSTLLFELPPAGLQPECAGPYPNSGFTEFVMALRAHGLRHGALPVYMPFTQPALHATAQRVLHSVPLAPNRYDTWGHCFGSDPWIGLIETLNAGPRPPQAATAPQGGSNCAWGGPAHSCVTSTRVLAGAIGFNGYYTLGAIDLAPGLLAEFRRAEHAAPLPLTPP